MTYEQQQQEEMLLWSFKNKLYNLNERWNSFDICYEMNCEECEYESLCHIQKGIDIVTVKEFIEKYPEYKIIL